MIEFSRWLVETDHLNYLVWVEGVDNQAHELSDLSLKCEGLNLAHLWIGSRHFFQILICRNLDFKKERNLEWFFLELKILYYFSLLFLYIYQEF